MLAPVNNALAAWKLSKRPFGDIGLKHFPVKYLGFTLLLVPVATWIAGSVEFGMRQTVRKSVDVVFDATRAYTDDGGNKGSNGFSMEDSA